MSYLVLEGVMQAEGVVDSEVEIPHLLLDVLHVAGMTQEQPQGVAWLALHGKVMAAADEREALHREVALPLLDAPALSQEHNRESPANLLDRCSSPSLTFSLLLQLDEAMYRLLDHDVRMQELYPFPRPDVALSPESGLDMRLVSDILEDRLSMLQKHLILQVVEIIYLLALVDLILSAIRYFQSNLLLQLVDWIMLPALDLDFV